MIIATRVLKLKQDGGDVDVPVRMSAPVRQAEKAWSCEFEIGFPDGAKRQAGHGIDAAQALIHALWNIGLVLHTSAYHESGDLYWEKPGDGYGFPVIGPNRDVLIGSDAKYF